MEGAPYRHQRHPLEAAHRFALARPPGEVRSLQTCYDRWRRDGTWERLLAQAQTKSDAVGEVEWEVSVDDTVIRAHQHAAGARGASSAADEKRGS